MDSSEVMLSLSKQLEKFEWFTGRMEINPILHHSIVVYVKYMNSEVYREVPDVVNGWAIRPWFVGYADCTHVISKPSTLEKMASEVGTLPTGMLAAGPPPFESGLDFHHEVWKLSKVCGRSKLEDIFYEIHDGEDAVTNQSANFPEIRTKLEALYDEFGFDVLFDEFDNDF